MELEGKSEPSSGRYTSAYTYLEQQIQIVLI